MGMGRGEDEKAGSLSLYPLSESQLQTNPKVLARCIVIPHLLCVVG